MFAAIISRSVNMRLACFWPAGCFQAKDQRESHQQLGKGGIGRWVAALTASGWRHACMLLLLRSSAITILQDVRRIRFIVLRVLLFCGCFHYYCLSIGPRDNCVSRPARQGL